MPSNPNPNPSPNPSPSPNQVVYSQRSLGLFATPIEAARALRDEYLALEAQPSDGGMGGERPVKLQPNPNPAVDPRP